MTSFNLTGFSTLARTLGNGETGYLAQGSTLSPDTETPLTMDDGVVIVEGAILARNSNIAAISVAGIPDILVTSTGSVTSARSAAIVNAGSFFGNITNNGEIYGRLDAIKLTGGSAEIFNTGTIESPNGAAISMTDGLLGVMNSGTVLGAQTAILCVGSVNCTVTNTGLISAFFTAIQGGSGFDRVTNHGTINGSVLLGSGDDIFRGALGTQGQVNGDAGNDQLIGGAANETLDGGLGNDLLLGNSGDDSMLGGLGLDVLRGGLGEDTLNGGGDEDRLLGGAGSDTLLGDLGNDILSGGDDDDSLQGDAGNDLLLGDAGDDLLTGGDGADTLRGGLGNDTLVGGAGADALNGGSGDDTMTGGGNPDTFFFAFGNGNDLITDFADNADKLNLRAFGIADLSTLVSHASDVTGGLLIDLSAFHGGSITLSGMTLAQLSAQDVLL